MPKVSWKTEKNSLQQHLVAVEGFANCEPGMVVGDPWSWILLLNSRTRDTSNLVVP